MTSSCAGAMPALQVTAAALVIAKDGIGVDTAILQNRAVRDAASGKAAR